MKPNDNDRTRLRDRLAYMLGELALGRKLDPEELAIKFSTSTRTISRDLKALGEGVVERRRDDQGRTYYFLADQTLRALNVSELRAFADVSGVRKLYPESPHLLRSLLRDKASQYILVRGHNYDTPPDEGLLKLLTDYIGRRQEIGFYYGRAGESKNGGKAGSYRNHVQPYKIVNLRGIWYLAALEAGTPKLFRLAEIRGVQEDGCTFTLNTEVAVMIEQARGPFLGPRQEVVLRVESKVIDYFTRRDVLPNQKNGEILQDGSLLVRADYAHPNEILPLIKYWLPHVQIVSPDNLRQQLMRQIRDYLALVEGRECQDLMASLQVSSINF